ncbi:PREDICTED: PDZK1-interacting protein 1 isoform X1 [Bison bison bison]|uniref:PDZK1-interacting protein 1 n=1 Tax=Bison bison bison TaxID=43346 RepID=A0A6P3H2B3_BISBB|nr:PREDICTED: PDZK1-interacting protein 1 isoform X1 [Bison bison bison]
MCLSSVWPGSLGLTEHGDVQGEESPLGLPVAEGRDFWEILRVRGGVKGQGSKSREGIGWGLSPLGTQPEEPKGDQVGSSPPAKTQRELGPLSCLSKGRGNLQPWMQGLIAVAVFLVLVAIAFAVNHFWCQEKPAPINMVMTIGNKADGILVGTDGKYSSMAASFRSSEHENAYENIPEEEGKVCSTPM